MARVSRGLGGDWLGVVGCLFLCFSSGQRLGPLVCLCFGGRQSLGLDLRQGVPLGLQEGEPSGRVGADLPAPGAVPHCLLLVRGADQCEQDLPAAGCRGLCNHLGERIADPGPLVAVLVGVRHTQEGGGQGGVAGVDEVLVQVAGAVIVDMISVHAVGEASPLRVHSVARNS